MRRPNGYLRQCENVERELQIVIGKRYVDDDSVIKEGGEFPTAGQLAKIDSGLGTAITKYHGGFPKVRRRMGYSQIRREMGYLQDWGNVERELRVVIGNEYYDEEGEVIKKKGEFPTTMQLRKIDWGLSTAITEYHGGFPKVRRRMGYEELVRKPGYLQDWGNVERELRVVIANEYSDDKGNMIKRKGEFPTSEQLREIDSGLGTGITDYHGGLREVKRRMVFDTDSISTALFNVFQKEAELAELYSSGIISVDILVEIISSLREFEKLPRSYLQAIIPKLNLGPVMYEPEGFEDKHERNGRSYEDFERIMERAVRYVSKLNGKADDLVERLYGEVLRVVQVDEAHAVSVIERLDRMIEKRENRESLEPDEA